MMPQDTRRDIKMDRSEREDSTVGAGEADRVPGYKPPPTEEQDSAVPCGAH